MQLPKYSLLLPVRNEVSRIGGIVHAIFEDLKTIGDWEIFFGDDFSDDGTYECLLKLAQEFDFRLIHPPKNIGRGAIRNLLAHEARAPMLVFLDGDCRVQTGFFKAWENTSPTIAYLGRVNYELLPKSGFSNFLSTGSGIGKLGPKDKIPPAYFISQNFCLSKTIFDKVNGFRTDLSGWGGEDVDLGYKLLKMGVPISYNLNAIVQHPSVINLEAYFSRLKLFGEANLPVLVSDNWEIGVQFKLRFARKPWSWFFCNPVLFRLSYYLITRFKSFYWPFLLYRYATFYCYACGYNSRPGRDRLHRTGFSN